MAYRALSAIRDIKSIHGIEQAIAMSFNNCNERNLNELIEASDASVPCRQVRDVEAFIEANWNRPISMEDINARTNVSARAIFKAFRRHRGYSPMAFAKRVRLDRARQMLSAAEPQASVTGIAFACGFGNLGHFARDYRAFANELPSETLARARQRAVGAK
jgi:transcriptional regulator GlxA family with amidase domain